MFECGCSSACSETTPVPPVVRFGFRIHSSNFRFFGENIMFQLKDSDKVTTLPLDIRSAKGNPAQVEAGTVVWSVSDPAVLALTDNGDGTVTVAAVGPVGAAQLQVSADADLGEGVKTVTGAVEIEVIAGDAAVINVALGATAPQ
jgi:hypothetical protein